jgi:hypothetical protein
MTELSEASIPVVFLNVYICFETTGVENPPKFVISSSTRRWSVQDAGPEMSGF